MNKQSVLLASYLAWCCCSDASAQSSPKFWMQHNDHYQRPVQEDDPSYNINPADPNDPDDDFVFGFSDDLVLRWQHYHQWQTALSMIDVYSIHGQYFKVVRYKKDGTINPNRRYVDTYDEAMMFLKAVRDKLPMPEISDVDIHNNNCIPTHGNKTAHDILYDAYLTLVLQVLDHYNIAVMIHSVGAKTDFVPWSDMPNEETADPDDYLEYDVSGLQNTKDLVSRINYVAPTHPQCVRYVKLQSVLSGNYKRGLANNVHIAAEFARQLQDFVYNHPEDQGWKGYYLEFYLGDALLQNHDDPENDWDLAFHWFNSEIQGKLCVDLYGKQNWPPNHHHSTPFYQTYADVGANFRGIRVEFDKQWGQYAWPGFPEEEGYDDQNGFERSSGWDELEAAIDLIHGFEGGWEIGVEHNNPNADGELLDGDPEPELPADSEYLLVALRTAAKIQQVGDCDFVVVHSDAGGGHGGLHPVEVVPENLNWSWDEAPTFSTAVIELHRFYELP